MYPEFSQNKLAPYSCGYNLIKLSELIPHIYNGFYYLLVTILKSNYVHVNVEPPGQPPNRWMSSRYIPETRTLKILSSVPLATDLREVDTCGNITRILLHEKIFNNNNSILYNNALNNKQRKHKKKIYHSGQAPSCANNKQNINRYLVITQYVPFPLLADINNSEISSLS
jgi:NADH:ubiquinone oxidoreductase subunit 3 (subunit A)